MTTIPGESFAGPRSRTATATSRPVPGAGATAALLACLACAPVAEPQPAPPPPSPAAAAPRVATDADTARLVFYDYRLPAQRVGELSARFDDGSGERRVPASEIRLRDMGSPSSATYATRNSGTLRVTVSLRHEGRTSEGSFEVALRDDWIWGIAIHLTDGGSPGHCWGCLGRHVVPLAAPIAGATTLYVEFGGNSINQPVVY